MAGLRRVDDGGFRAEVEEARGLVLVDFTAAWCGPCRVMNPALEALAEEYGGRARFLALDTDANPATPARFGVRGLPTLLFFRDGALVDRSVGVVPRGALRERIEANLSAAPVGA